MSGFTGGSTSVPNLLITTSGIQLPLQSAIAAGIAQDLNSAFGGNIAINGENFWTTPFGQWTSSMTAILGATNNALAALFQQFNPQYAVGLFQDAIASITPGLVRFPGQPTVLFVLCGGDAGVQIQPNAFISDTSGNLYYNAALATIGSNGTVVATFNAQNTGPIPLPLLNSTTSVDIVTAQNGWDQVQVISGAVGSNVEGRAAFEQRRELAVAANSTATDNAIRGAILTIPGVIDCYVTDNPTNIPATIGNVSIGANQLYVCVAGGAPNDIANTIFTKKIPGCGMAGNTNVTVTNSNAGYSTPYPTYTIVYQIPNAAQLCFNIAIKNSTGVPANAPSLIGSAISSVITPPGSGTQLGSIGSFIYANQYAPAIEALGSWAEPISILMGSSGQPTATFNGNISGTTMSTSGNVGVISVGQYIFGGNVLAGTKTTSGSGNTWMVSPAQTVNVTAMSSVAASQASVQLPINQIPTFNPSSITVTLV